MSDNPYRPPVLTGEPPRNPDDSGKLLRVAKAQRHIMYALLAGIAMNIGTSVLKIQSMEMQIAVIAIALIIIGLMISVMYRLAKELNSNTVAVIYAILMIVPCVSLIMLLVVNQQATSYLQRFGIKVGLMGASLKQFEK